MEAAAPAAPTAEEQTARQLVLCFDGTNNTLTGGASDTNVARLCGLLAADGERQLLYYDPGVGNPGSIPGVTGLDWLRGRTARIWGLAFGRGVYENIAEAYVFLMRHWRATDRIYIYGFSRGAFTARSLAGLVNRFGILQPSMESLVPTLLHLYFADPYKESRRGRSHEPQAGKATKSGDGEKRDKRKDDYERIQTQILECFCDEPRRNAAIWFIGVWDTVESVGAPLFRTRIRANAGIEGKRFHHVRHALSLDEHRRSFSPRLYRIDPHYPYADKGQSIDQRWFAGAHCDVGGGYPSGRSGLALHSLRWMLEESLAHGLRLQPRYLAGGRLDAKAVEAAVAGARSPAAVAHAETYGNAWWAFPGLQVRDGSIQDPAGPGVPAGEDPSVARDALRFPQDTVWARARTFRGLGAMAALAVACFFLHGAILAGPASAPVADTEPLARAVGHLQRWAAANGELARWQFWGWRSAGTPVEVAHGFRMLLADGAFMLCYGYVLARGVTVGFAHLAGLRRAGARVPRFARGLGMALTVALCADLAEDLLTLAAQQLRAWPGGSWSFPFCAALMSFASTAKYAGILMSVGLCLYGGIARFARRPRPPGDPLARRVPG